MSPRLRQILIISGFVLITAAFFYVIYLVFFKPSPLVPTNNVTTGNINGLPGVGNGNINGLTPGNVNTLPIINGSAQQPSNVASGGPTTTQTLVNTSTLNLTSAADKSLRYYDKTSGKFFQISADGTAISPLSDVTYFDISDLSWSPDGQQAIISFPDGSKVLYNFSTKKQSTLPKELSDFSFGPQSNKVVSKYLDPANTDNQWLVVSQPDGSQSQTAEHLGENADKVTPRWSPNNQIIATYEKSTTSDLSEIIFLGANGENFPSATIAGKGFTPVWSPDGRRILFSAYSDETNNNPHLYMMNGSPDQVGTNLIDLGLDTSADKCVFSGTGSSVYCAVPYYLNPGSGPQPELSAGIPDNIYLVDLNRGTSELIARPVDANQNQRYSASNLQLSPSEDVLYFLDTVTGTIQKIRLR